MTLSAGFSGRDHNGVYLGNADDGFVDIIQYLTGAPQIAATKTTSGGNRAGRYFSNEISPQIDEELVVHAVTLPGLIGGPGLQKVYDVMPRGSNPYLVVLFNQYGWIVPVRPGADALTLPARGEVNRSLALRARGQVVYSNFVHGIEFAVDGGTTNLVVPQTAPSTNVNIAVRNTAYSFIPSAGGSESEKWQVQDGNGALQSGTDRDIEVGVKELTGLPATIDGGFGLKAGAGNLDQITRIYLFSNAVKEGIPNA